MVDSLKGSSIDSAIAERLMDARFALVVARWSEGGSKWSRVPYMMKWTYRIH